MRTAVWIATRGGYVLTDGSAADEHLETNDQREDKLEINLGMEKEGRHDSP